MTHSEYLNLHENKVDWGLGKTRPCNWNLKMCRACFMSMWSLQHSMYIYVEVNVLVTSRERLLMAMGFLLGIVKLF